MRPNRAYSASLNRCWRSRRMRCSNKASTSSLWVPASSSVAASTFSTVAPNGPGNCVTCRVVVPVMSDPHVATGRDVDRLAGDASGTVAGQERHGFRDIGGARKPRQDTARIRAFEDFRMVVDELGAPNNTHRHG